MEKLNKQIDLRFNFAVGPSFERQIKVFNKFFDTMKNDKYILRYSISAKTMNEDSKHSTPNYFDEYKDEFFENLEKFSKQFPNVTYKAERPFFKCNFKGKKMEDLAQKFGIKYYCGMEFTIDPTGVCGLCPPVTLMANPYEAEAKDCQDFLKIIQHMRNLTDELSSKPSFDICIDCQEQCQGGCLSYKF
jgi:hypothetical protein